MLRRYWWLVLLGALAGVGIASYQLQQQRPRYRAHAVMQLTNERESLTSGLEGGGAPSALGRGVDRIRSQIEVLRSRRVAGEVVDAVGLLRLEPVSRDFPREVLRDVFVGANVGAGTLRVDFAADGYTVRAGDVAEEPAAYGEPVEVAGVRFAVARRPPASSAALRVAGRDAAIGRVLDGLTARAREGTNVVDLGFVHHDPRVAQEVVNAAATTFQSINTRSAQQQSRRRREFIEEQLRTTDSLLADAQFELTQFRSREQVYSTRDRLSAQQQGLISLETRREELAADRDMLADLIRRIGDGTVAVDGVTLRTLVSAPGMASNAVVSTFYQQLVEYETALDTLTTGPRASAETNPQVQRLRALVEQTKRNLLDAARSHVASLDARIAALDSLRARNAESLAGMPGIEAEEMRLAQQVETMQKMADLLRDELQRARIAEAVEAGPVEIVDYAVLPGAPIGEGRTRKLVFGLLVGLLLGGGGAILLERLNTSIRRREEIEGVMQVPGLAVIPKIPTSPRGRLPLALGGNGRRDGGGRGGGRAGGGRGGGSRAGGGQRRGGAPARPDAGSDPALVSLEENRSSEAEAYRTLRTNLLFSRAVQTLRSVVVTSPLVAEGKTTTAGNLAVTFAQQGVRVLLMDCDLRRSRMHRVFGVEREPGLTQVLLEQVDVSDAIRATGVDGLALLPAGVLPPNPSELLGGRRMRELMAALRDSYKLLIIDSPPLLAATDAAVLSTLADGVLLVVRAGDTDRSAAEEAVQRLSNVGAHIVGAVLNDPDAKVPKYGKRYYYSNPYAAAD